MTDILDFSDKHFKAVIIKNTSMSNYKHIWNKLKKKKKEDNPNKVIDDTKNSMAI